MGGLRAVGPLELSARAAPALFTGGRDDNAECHESRAIVTGLGLVCLALFLGVSLYTHSPYDVLDYHVAQSQEIQNKAGRVGAQLAHHAFCLYGVRAWVLTILMLLCADPGYAR